MPARTAQALSHRAWKPIVGRDQHHPIFYTAALGALTARGLNGKRVGVRAYTQTTGAWVRGFLAEDSGVGLDSGTWVAFEGRPGAGGGWAWRWP